VTDQPDEILAGLDFPVTDALEGETVDMTAVLLRRFAWDTTTCDTVPELITALGLDQGEPEVMEAEHQESQLRMSTVFPLESHLRAYSAALGKVITEAMVGGLPDIDDVRDEHIEALSASKEGLADQNAMVLLTGARAIIGQLLYSGFLTYGPLVAAVQVRLVDDDDEDGTGE
jgi:hypothetical protein